jgi:hypothetical protein
MRGLMKIDAKKNSSTPMMAMIRIGKSKLLPPSREPS